jgi:hypothetical protein
VYYCYGVLREGTADERTINTFGQYYLNGAGVATPDPGEAPPLAEFNMRLTAKEYTPIHTCIHLNYIQNIRFISYFFEIFIHCYYLQITFSGNLILISIIKIKS